jgi:hypothetical protein
VGVFIGKFKEAVDENVFFFIRISAYLRPSLPFFQELTRVAFKSSHDQNITLEILNVL